MSVSSAGCWRPSPSRGYTPRAAGAKNEPRDSVSRFVLAQTPPPRPLPEAERGSRNALSPPPRSGEGVGGWGSGLAVQRSPDSTPRMDTVGCDVSIEVALLVCEKPTLPTMSTASMRVKKLTGPLGGTLQVCEP